MVIFLGTWGACTGRICFVRIRSWQRITVIRLRARAITLSIRLGACTLSIRLGACALSISLRACTLCISLGAYTLSISLGAWTVLMIRWGRTRITPSNCVIFSLLSIYELRPATLLEQVSGSLRAQDFFLRFVNRVATRFFWRVHESTPSEAQVQRTSMNPSPH